MWGDTAPWALTQGSESCTFYTRDSRVQSPFPAGHVEYTGNRTGRLTLEVVTAEEKAQSIEQVGGRSAQLHTTRKLEGKSPDSQPRPMLLAVEYG